MTKRSTTPGETNVPALVALKCPSDTPSFQVPVVPSAKLNVCRPPSPGVNA